MKCPTCPVTTPTCLGESASRICALARGSDDYRRQLVRTAEDLILFERSGARSLDVALAAVSSCPHRGPVLPLIEQPECGCDELRGCRSGRGAVPGRVTLRDCLVCEAGREAADRVDRPAPRGA